MSSPIKPWTRTEADLIYEARVFDLYRERLKSPDNEYEDYFYFVKTADWANVIALTEKEEVVLVEQYRVGIDRVTLELPGGMIATPDTDPLETAKRELLEETGYVGSEFEPIGSSHPNPALLTNRSYFYLARGVSKARQQNLDPAERIHTVLVPLRNIPAMIKDGRITHSLMINAFYFLFLRHSLFGSSRDT
jgi:8-oxo-dGTP pyrophosphatase MutT (NUDIX family)